MADPKYIVIDWDNRCWETHDSELELIKKTGISGVINATKGFVEMPGKVIINLAARRGVKLLVETKFKLEEVI